MSDATSAHMHGWHPSAPGALETTSELTEARASSIRRLR